MQVTKSIQAGRELDVLIASKVLGQKPAPSPDAEGREGEIGRWLRDRGALTFMNGQWWDSVAPYSTEIEYAWHVVEAMAQRVEESSDPHHGFTWDGPLFKPSHNYGIEWPLGTTCWYVVVENDGQ